MLQNGRRCPNSVVPGTRYCALPGHDTVQGDDVVAEVEVVEVEAALEEVAVAPPTEDSPGDDEPAVEVAAEEAAVAVVDDFAAEAAETADEAAADE
jgi:hypothetical protein